MFRVSPRRCVCKGVCVCVWVSVCVCLCVCLWLWLWLCPLPRSCPCLLLSLFLPPFPPPLPAPPPPPTPPSSFPPPPPLSLPPSLLPSFSPSGWAWAAFNSKRCTLRASLSESLKTFISTCPPPARPYPAWCRRTGSSQRVVRRARCCGWRSWFVTCGTLRPKLLRPRSCIRSCSLLPSLSSPPAGRRTVFLSPGSNR